MIITKETKQKMLSEMFNLRKDSEDNLREYWKRAILLLNSERFTEMVYRFHSGERLSVLEKEYLQGQV